MTAISALTLLLASKAFSALHLTPPPRILHLDPKGT